MQKTMPGLLVMLCAEAVIGVAIFYWYEITLVTTSAVSSTFFGSIVIFALLCTTHSKNNNNEEKKTENAFSYVLLSVKKRILTKIIPK